MPSAGAKRPSGDAVLCCPPASPDAWTNSGACVAPRASRSAEPYPRTSRIDWTTTRYFDPIESLDAKVLPFALARHLVGLPPAAIDDVAECRQVRRRPKCADRVRRPLAFTVHRASPYSAMSLLTGAHIVRDRDSRRACCAGELSAAGSMALGRAGRDSPARRGKPRSASWEAETAGVVPFGRLRGDFPLAWSKALRYSKSMTCRNAESCGIVAKIRWHDLRHIRRAVYSPRSELSLARRCSSSASSVRRRLISRLTRVSSALACCSLT
jgi:hypothetical protein